MIRQQNTTLEELKAEMRKMAESRAQGPQGRYSLMDGRSSQDSSVYSQGQPSLQGADHGLGNDGDSVQPSRSDQLQITNGPQSVQPSPQPTAQLERYEQGPQQPQPGYGRRRDVQEPQRLNPLEQGQEQQRPEPGMRDLPNPFEYQRPNRAQNESWVLPSEQASYDGSRPESLYATPAQTPPPMEESSNSEGKWRQYGVDNGLGKKAGVYRVL